MCTTRFGGISQPPYAEFNLGDHVGDDPKTVATNRQQLAEQLELPSEPRWLQQTHSTVIVDAEKETFEQPPEADAIVCRTPGVVCVVQTADCLPVLLCNRRGDCIAAVHAGWRGLSNSIIEKTVEAMNVDPAEILVWLGPAIGPQAFEVGPEVVEAFVTFNSRHADAFVQTSDTRWRADIYTLARQRLQAVGVSYIIGGDRCTVNEPDLFFSYRREGVTGRMASLIWIDD